MKFADDERHIIFSSGKTVYCFGDVVGLAAEYEHDGRKAYHRIRYGWDGHITTCLDEYWKDWDETPDKEALTPPECIELAEYMIGIWTKYLEGIQATMGEGEGE
jgi:hypothetical protein